MVFWKNGFSIDDGPLFHYDDPNNREVLALIDSGRAPLSIMNVLPNQSVEVRVERKTDEDYKPPKSAKVFEGSGQRLGA